MRPSAARVLARLRQGPATTHDLMQADVGGVRFSARVHELREEGFSISERRLRPGSSEYRLDAEQALGCGDASTARTPPCNDDPAGPSLAPAPAEHLFGADEYRAANDYRDVA